MIFVRNKTVYKGNGFYIGRPSILGNPFSHLKGKTLARFTVDTRQEAIDRYEEYFKEQILNSLIFREMTDCLKNQYIEGNDINLICWCHPLSCHGDVIKEYIENG